MSRLSLLENVARTVQAWPQRTAIVDGGQSLSFAEFWRRSAAFAASLQDRGLQAGDRVAVVLENSWQYAVAFYGALMAGGVAVPLNAAARATDHAGWAAHSQARFVVGSEASAQWRALPPLLGDGVQSIACGSPSSEFEMICQAQSAPPPADCASHKPACIHYTSGTTGNPKGVLLSHGNLASNAAAIVEYLQLTADDSMVTILPFYYAYGSSVLHSHLIAGGRLILEQGFTFPHVVMQRVASERATGFAGVPSTFALLLARVDLSTFDLSALRYLTQAGGAMSPAMAARLSAAMPGKRIYVMYGQTEATSRLTYLPPDKLSSKPGSVGIPIPGVQIQVRNEQGEPCTTGEVGHVWAHGPNVMLGYWRNPEATSQVLRDGWLSTGDMGHLDNDGFLHLAGRRSDIIKVGAHRVHPQDVEDVIAELPDIVEVAVAGQDDEVLGEVIHAFVVAREHASVTVQQVKRHCLTRLAPYKVPKEVHMVSELPRTASGKIRRSALPTKGRPE
jgi:long-chain acyl-CoA synthetase